jgi:hypothetical protein
VQCTIFSLVECLDHAAMRRVTNFAPILSIKWNFVRGSWWWWWSSSFFMYLQYCSTDLLYMCRCVVNKTPGRPRAQGGTRTTGNSRALIHGRLRAAHQSAKNTHLKLCSKHIAAKPRIARVPELVRHESRHVNT